MYSCRTIEPSLPVARKSWLLTLVFALAMCVSACFAQAEQHSKALKQTLDELSRPSAENGIKILFTEARSFPFRRYPKRFEGAAYMAPDGKLAIAYYFPSSYRIFIEEDQIELIHGDGETRDLSDEAGLRLFTDLLKWNTEAISRNWTATKIDQQDDRYHITLEPLDLHLAKSIKEFSINFDSQRVFSVSIKQKDGVDRKYEFGPAESERFDNPEFQKAFSK